jgi:hypothetical protein
VWRAIERITGVVLARRLRTSLLLVLGLALSTGVATAGDERDEKRACILAFERSQALRDEGRFGASREQAIACSRATCPGMVRKDCSDVVADLQRRAPSFVLAIRDDRGADVVDARITLDGRPVAAGAGRAITVDPGVHRLEIDGAPRFQRTEAQVVLREGEKERAVEVRLRAAAAVARGQVEPASPGAGTSSRLPLLVAAGGAAAAVVGVASFIVGQRQIDEAAGLCPRSECATSADLRRARDLDGDGATLKTIGVVLGGAGAVLVGGGVVWFVLQPSSAGNAASVGWRTVW